MQLFALCFLAVAAATKTTPVASNHHMKVAAKYAKMHKMSAGVHSRSLRLRKLTELVAHGPAKTAKIEHKKTLQDDPESAAKTALDERCKACEVAEDAAVDAFSAAADAHRDAQSALETLNEDKVKLIDLEMEAEDEVRSFKLDVSEILKKLELMKEQVRAIDIESADEGMVEITQTLLNSECDELDDETDVIHGMIEDLQYDEVKKYDDLMTVTIPAAEGTVGASQTAYDGKADTASGLDDDSESKNDARDAACALTPGYRNLHRNDRGSRKQRRERKA